MSLLKSIFDNLNTLSGVKISLARSINSFPELIAAELPYVFVHYFDSPETPPNQTIGVVTQRIPIRFCVLIASENYNLNTGQDQLEDTRNEIFEKLIGIVPKTGFDPVEYVGGALIADAYSQSVVWWRDIFITHQYFRSI